MFWSKGYQMLESPTKIFDDPTARKTLSDLAKLSDEMAAKKRARKRVPESAIIDVGMLRAVF